MPDRLFYIGGEWLTYEQAHRLGYTLLPPKILTLYTSSNTSTSVRKDIQTDQYYDSSNLRWVDDFNELGLYSYINTITCFKGESSDDYRGYSSHSNSNEITHILYDGVITDLNYLYIRKGITLYKCTNIMLDTSNNPIVWYDSKTNKYFDDREVHAWVDRIDDVQVTLYDTYTNTPTQIYESETSFFLNGSSISKEDFYSNDNYGIIRDTLYTFKDSSSYETYYDSYSDEYCIPNVIDVWVSRNDIIALGYLFIEGLAELWQCVTPLYLPWKYLPRTATIRYTNTAHSDLSIVLPPDYEALTGEEIILPSITGIYEDSSEIKWKPTRWSVGEFDSQYILNADVVTDLICEKLKVTVRFANTYYSSLDIQLPEPRTVDNGDTIVLPTIEGEYEDADHIKWYPQRWSIGEFDSSLVLRNDVTANIICEKMRVTLSFTNNSHRELEIPLPGIIERHYGDTVILPRMRGVYRDEDNHPWIPLKWSLDEFDRLYTITESTSTDLVWQPLSEIPEIALCGSMPSDSGSSAETSDYIVLVAVGSMKLDLPDWPSTYLTDNYEVYSGQIEVWDSHYVQPIEPDFEKNSYITSDQMICGTIRKWGVNDNSYIDFSMACSTIKSDPMRYADIKLTYNPEIYGDRIKIWDSSYEQSSIDFPVKSGESSEQMYGGTIRKWGIYANHEILMSECSLIGNSSLDPMAYTDIKLTYNPEIYGDRLKVYDKQYTPMPEPEFPDKPVVEPNNQMYGGTIRLKGNKANRGISIDVVFDDYINPNDS